VDKLVLFGPAPWFASDSCNILSWYHRCKREFLDRWRDALDGQLGDPEVCNAHGEIMAVDEVGAT
jgi:hypothetical protein